MQYIFTIIDERLNLPIIEEAKADIHGMTEILKRFTCMKQAHRIAFIDKLNTGVAQEHMGSQHQNNEGRYTIVARPLVEDSAGEKLLRDIFETPTLSSKETTMKTVHRGTVVLNPNRIKSVEIGDGKILAWKLDAMRSDWMDIWFEMELDEPIIERKYVIAVPSNAPIPSSYTYVGTQHVEGEHPWHLFVGPEPYQRDRSGRQ